MSLFKFDSSLTEKELHCKEIYDFFTERGVDLSFPRRYSEVQELMREYNKQNNEESHSSAHSTRSNAGSRIIDFISTEDLAFRTRFDVSVTHHLKFSCVPFHAHEYFEILVTARGNAQMYLGETLIPQTTGDVFIVPPYSGHSNLVFNENCDMFSFAIRYTGIKNRFPELFRSEHVLSDFFSRNYEVATPPSFLVFHTGDYFLGDNLLAAIYDEFQNPTKLSPEIANLYAAHFLLTLVQNWSDSSELITFSDTRPQLETLIMQYINEHIDTVSLAELSQKFSYSERHIARLIKQCTGENYSDLVKKIKMEYVGELVADPALPIEKIVSVSGISSSSYFYKLFRAYYGKTPKEYREDILNKSNLRNVEAF